MLIAITMQRKPSVRLSPLALAGLLMCLLLIVLMSSGNNLQNFIPATEPQPAVPDPQSPGPGPAGQAGLLPQAGQETTEQAEPETPAQAETDEPAASTAMDQEGTLWAPYLEWSVENPSYSGNPFDLVAKVTFTHPASGKAHTTEMFYDGGSTWKFRFSGTATGEWRFSSQSDDPELNGLSGKVTIRSNPNPDVKGPVVAYGNKFARVVGENGELEAMLFNIWQGGDFPGGISSWVDHPNLERELGRGLEQVVFAHGANVLFAGNVANRWFDYDAMAWDEHNSENPDIRTFEGLEQGIAYANSRGVVVHFWAWGDNARKETPIGAGGINGVPDRRVQRYIAARLGPILGWTMGYGFDLEEWVSEDQVRSWAEYIDEHMGWPHMLWARNRSNSAMDAVAYNGKGPNRFEDVLNKIQSDKNRPHLEEERFIYMRYDKYDMDTTRRQMWWNAMAGGMGSFWGWWDGPHYPNPEQMRTAGDFWKERFLLDMAPTKGLSDGLAIKNSANTHFVFYREDVSSIRMDLSKMAGEQRAVAVDTKKAYAEIDLGRLKPGEQTWEAPYKSDWAIAVGQGRPPVGRPPQLDSILHFLSIIVR